MKGIIYKKRANVFLLKLILVSLFFLAVGILFCLISNSYRPKSGSAFSASSEEVKTVIIDAGHGGIDGGAVVDGIYEKDINLKLSKKISAFLSLYNINCIMTRTDDVLLCDENSSRKKLSDLLNRVKIAKQYDDPAFVSIHMNKFPESKYSGLQVFYSPNNDMSETLAKTVQEKVRQALQNSNKREIKKAGSAIYVLDRLDCPAILIECGFLSNPDELKLLLDDNYLTNLAFIISLSIVECLQ